MCMACDFLQGLDIDALSPADAGGAAAVLLPDGLGSAELKSLFPRDDSALAGRLKRSPARQSNQHWEATALRAAVTAAAEGPAPRALGLAQAAIEEFRHFWLAKLEGAVPLDTRFQLALPTPYTLLASLLPQADVLAALPRLEAAMRAEVASLLETLPAEELAIQWDACAETRVWETRGRDLSAPRGLPERLLESFVAICEAVPAAAQLGFHFCHRGAQGQPPIVPADSGQVSRLLGAIIASTEREPQFVHVPVPAGIEDGAYFQPLANLALWPAMEIHLGLLHEGQELAASMRTLDAAQRALRGGGLGPACGVDPQQVLWPLVHLLVHEPAAEA